MYFESTVRQNHHHKKKKREVDKWRKYCFGYFCPLKLEHGRESSLCVWEGLRKYKPAGVMVWTPEQKSIKEMCALRDSSSFMLEVEKAERLMWPFHKEAVSKIIICCGANWLKMAGQG